jgi:3-phosphoshikimate 1-carboxyvinyltransferase
MKHFEFKGELSASKSLLNRALILKAYAPELKITGDSNSRDVQFLKAALDSSGSEFQVGEGGTTLRFLALYLSRKPGQWKISGSARLFSRPMRGLTNLLSQLSVSFQVQDQSLILQSQGWKIPETIQVDLSESSQFATALILNSWHLPQNLKMEFSKNRVSDGYLEMTLSLVKKAGLHFELDANQNLLIFANQKLEISELTVEPDLSSAFVVAALAAARGHCEIESFPNPSLQPDHIFVELFQKMNIPTKFENKSLVVSRAESIAPIRVSLNSAPDLFPVLCVLLSKAKGESEIYNTPQLIFKESNRLQKTSELLTLMKVRHQVQSAGIKIFGPASHHHEFFEFDSDHDHRLAFAAALAKSMGYRLKINHPEVVDKSFPGFWNLISGGPG